MACLRFLELEYSKVGVALDGSRGRLSRVANGDRDVDIKRVDLRAAPTTRRRFGEKERLNEAASTIKPVALHRRVLDCSIRGDVILDTFLGIGRPLWRWSAGGRYAG